MRSAAAYIRVSTDDQTEYSPEAQLRAIRDYCVKNEFALDSENIYIDEGYSGRKAEKRPAFMKMIRAAKQKPAPFEVILCHKFDRFARSREDSVVYKSLLHKECGVRVLSITESIDNDKMGLIMESMLEAMAEYYSINLGEEVKKGMTEKARRGEPLSVAPFGYRLENKKLVPVPEEAEAVRRIFSDFIGGKPYLQLAKQCNAAGFTTHRGGKFENRTIEYILRNPVYAGYIRWTPTKKIRRNFENPDSMIVKGGHPPLVDAAIYEAAQERARAVKALYQPYYKPQEKASHWLVGLLHCPCGSGMVNSNGYFVCGAHARGRCENRNAIKCETLEKMVLAALAADFEKTLAFQIIEAAEETDDNGFEQEMAQLRMRLRRAKEAYERGIDTIEEYAAGKVEISAEMALLERRKKPAAVSGTAQQALFDLQKALSDPQERAAVARRFIRRIVWDKNAQSLEITYYTLPF